MLEDTTGNAETESEADPTDVSSDEQADDQCNPNICSTRSRMSYIFVKFYVIVFVALLFSPSTAGSVL